MSNRTNVSFFVIVSIIFLAHTASAKPVIGEILKYVGEGLEASPLNPCNYFKPNLAPYPIIPSFPVSPCPYPVCPCPIYPFPSPVCPYPTNPRSPVCPCPTYPRPSPFRPSFPYPCPVNPCAASPVPSVSFGCSNCVPYSPCLYDDSCYGIN